MLRRIFPLFSGALVLSTMLASCGRDPAPRTSYPTRQSQPLVAEPVVRTATIPLTAPPAIAGLIGTWYFNALAIIQMRDFIGDLTSSGPAVSSFGVDLLVVAVAGSIFIIVEARRLRMRFGWLYVVGAALTAFAFTFPLFLAMRERRTTELAQAGE